MVQATKSKVLHLMRHGVTEMNVHLHKFGYPPRGGDPMMFDTRLTQEGIWGAEYAADKAAALRPEPEVLIVSPLTRALQTANVAFAHYKGPRVVEALARERVYLSSDAGRAPSELSKEFGTLDYSFDHLPDIWWYNGGHIDPKRVLLEPEEEFKSRVEDFKAHLLSRPENCIAIVSHWGVIREMTGGVEFDNCQIQTYRMEDDGRVELLNNPSLLSS